MRPKGRRAGIVGFVLLVAVALAGCMVPPEGERPQEARQGDGMAAEQHRIFTPETIAFQEGPPSLPPGARVAVLSGDPAADGPFTMRATVPAGYVIPPHTHPSAEHVTIISGNASLAVGAQSGQDQAAHLPPGSFFVVPPGMVHAFYAGDEQVVLQIHGQGPWGIQYVNPEDDPRGGGGEGRERD